MAVKEGDLQLTHLLGQCPPSSLPEEISLLQLSWIILKVSMCLSKKGLSCGSETAWKGGVGPSSSGRQPPGPSCTLCRARVLLPGEGRARPGLSTPMAAASVVCVLKWQQRRRQSCVARGLLCCTPGQHSVSRESGLGKAPDSHREPQRAATVEEGEEPPPLSAPGRTGHVGSLGGAGRQVICHGAVRGWALSA